MGCQQMRGNRSLMSVSRIRSLPRPVRRITPIEELALTSRLG